jgi:FkbH-like protein
MKMRLALLSNTTADFLADMLKKDAEVYLPSGFDTWQQEMMLPDSGLYAFKAEAVVVLLYANAYGDMWLEPEKASQTIEGWIAAAEAYAQRSPGVPVLISTLDLFGISCHYGAEPRPESRYESLFIERVEELHSKGRSVYLLPVKDAAADMGRDQFYSPKMWYIGSMPYSIKGLGALKDLILRYASVRKGAKKKCLAVDLDNTLWGGVIGEDGVAGIQLSDHKEGARFKDAQRVLKRMKDQGVMLAILSKNNVEDVEPVFSHPDMLLHHEDFVAELINWDPKTVGIRRLASDLNIGLDSFVFLDDNPAERERMKAECPEVSVIDFPKDSSLLAGVLSRAYDEFFLRLEVTGEDVKKTAMYRSEALRKAEEKASVSVEDFLKKLEMRMQIHVMLPEEEKRVTQLTNKTNQFNLTTKRYSEEEIRSFSLSDDCDVITVHMADKYGDQGLVSVLILQYRGREAFIDTFLMSCRVMGRCAENEIVSRLKNRLASRGVEILRAEYIKTAKNAPVLELYDRLGFAPEGGEIREIGDAKRYSIRVNDLPDSTGLFYEVKAEL